MSIDEQVPEQVVTLRLPIADSLVDLLASLVCSECGHHILQSHSAWECNYHNSCRCSRTNSSALAAALAALGGNSDA